MLVRTWLGKIALCSFLPLLPGPAWVLLSYVLHTLFLCPVFALYPFNMLSNKLHLDLKRHHVKHA